MILATNRPLEDWGHVLGDTAAACAILDRTSASSATRPKNLQLEPVST